MSMKIVVPVEGKEPAIIIAESQLGKDFALAIVNYLELAHITIQEIVENDYSVVVSDVNLGKVHADIITADENWFNKSDKTVLLEPSDDDDYDETFADVR